MKNTMFGQVVSKVMREIFSAIISLKDMNRSLEYIQNEFVKSFENVASF